MINDDGMNIMPENVILSQDNLALYCIKLRFKNLGQLFVAMGSAKFEIVLTFQCVTFNSSVNHLLIKDQSKQEALLFVINNRSELFNILVIHNGMIGLKYSEYVTEEHFNRLIARIG